MPLFAVINQIVKSKKYTLIQFLFVFLISCANHLLTGPNMHVLISNHTIYLNATN